MPDEDDLLVFYVNTQEAYKALLERAALQHARVVEPKNPYWAANATLLIDPDGYRVVIACT